MDARKPLWTLDELCERVERALAVDYPGQASGRVRDVPDRRTIRYYTTLGLIDRPAAMRGRTALYGVRHVLQLAAVKRLQAQGLSLAEVQARLVGLTDAALRQVARLPADFDFETPATDPANDGADRRAEAFWSQPPAEPGPPRELDEHDLMALRAAAAPLLALLRSWGLLAEDEGPSTPNGDAI